jgi:hypothetical protein
MEHADTPSWQSYHAWLLFRVRQQICEMSPPDVLPQITEEGAILQMQAKTTTASGVD